ncbi:MAG: hypothetical protein Q8O14_14235 [bacterium]|nr:hypothetical protein [bacterium]
MPDPSIKLRFRIAVLSAAGLLLAALLTGGCTRKEERSNDWPMGFHLPLGPEFILSGGLRPNGEGTLYFLRSDEPDDPRLVVRRRALGLSLEEFLEEEIDLGEQVELLDRGDPFPVTAVNATGLGLRQVVRPFPDFDSTLVLLFDVRAYLVGSWCYGFSWQQAPEDQAALAAYEGWMERLRFLPEADSPGDSLWDSPEDGP